ncbi:MAG TPA: hypothetical protein ENI17_11105 [Pseudomonas xinjiangensis]|uniref:Uncharacterized protein n=2 Tax=root TaxID=1 RepID=A0A7V1FRE0_9GAMM|nr:hypothetical protein [Halopseudomonas xinjiangensis]HEC48159.1 hypothetical protein [Halopseudomonas xinjiangensis]
MDIHERLNNLENDMKSILSVAKSFVLDAEPSLRFGAWQTWTENDLRYPLQGLTEACWGECGETLAADALTLVRDLEFECVPQDRTVFLTIQTFADKLSDLGESEDARALAKLILSALDAFPRVTH